jgi:hypothetical protein
MNNNNSLCRKKERKKEREREREREMMGIFQFTITFALTCLALPL